MQASSRYLAFFKGMSSGSCLQVVVVVVVVMAAPTDGGDGNWACRGKSSMFICIERYRDRLVLVNNVSEFFSFLFKYLITI